MATALTTTVVGHKAPVPLGTPPAGDTTGNTIVNSGDKTFLFIRNGSSSRTLGVSFARTVDGKPVEAWSHTIAANGEYLLKLGPVADYGSVVTVTPSHADVLIKAFELA